MNDLVPVQNKLYEDTRSDPVSADFASKTLVENYICNSTNTNTNIVFVMCTVKCVFVQCWVKCITLTVLTHSFLLALGCMDFEDTSTYCPGVRG